MDNDRSHVEERNGNELKHGQPQCAEVCNAEPKPEEAKRDEQVTKVGHKDERESEDCYSKKSELENYQINEPITKDPENNDQNGNNINNNERRSDSPQNKELISKQHQNDEPMRVDPQCNKPISKNSEQHEGRLENIQKNDSVSEDLKNNRHSFDDRPTTKPGCEDSKTNEQEFGNTQSNKPISEDTGGKDVNNDKSKSKELEERKSEGETSTESITHNHHSPVARLLVPGCGGIRERIELLGELLASEKPDSVPEVYDEMAHITAAIERNARLQTGTDGKCLLELTTAAKSNRNVDLHNLDAEIERQFGLHSVEVTGDGACAFRAILISGMQQPDVYQSELRENAIKQVLSNMAYYSTVLRPGEKVSEEELQDWFKAMTDPDEYGDEMANMALADRLHIQMAIFRAGELLSVINPRDGHVEHTAFLVNVGTHYKALVPRQELEDARRNSERLCK